jgi:hypothetical protein
MLTAVTAFNAPSFAGGLSSSQKVLAALSAGLTDSAFILLGNAVKKGLPDDSLYYLWAEIHIARGSLDTALALSIAGQRNNRGALKKTLLTQRYNIYLALGLKSDADELLDSILGSSPPARSTAIPRISINTWSGLNQRKSIVRQPYPFINETPAYEELTNQGQDVTLGSSWFLPFKNGALLVPGVSYNFTNGIERTEFSVDSLNHALGVSLELKNLWRRFSLGYAFQGRLSTYGGLSAVNTAKLSRSTISKSAISYSSLMYSIEVDENKAISYQALWLMHYLTRKLTSTIDLNVLPVLTCFLTDDLNSSYTSSLMYIEDPHADTVRHYTDATCTQLIPIPQNPFEQWFLPSRYRAAADMRTFSLIAPESYCGITPNAGLEFALPRGFSIEGTLKGMVNYYFKDHIWTSYSVPYAPGRPDDGSWIAYSTRDGNFYVVDELANISSSGERYSGPLDIREHRKRRIDFMIGGELTLERKLWNIGTLGLNAYVKKYRSTLQDDLPVKTKDLFYGGGISFKIYFGAIQPLSAL